MLFKEINREIEHGSDKIHLILHFPSEPSASHPAESLQQEIRAILSRELSIQLQCRKQNAAEQECGEQASTRQAAGNTLP